jgi:MOSC domain-containing protein YiiM
MMNFLTSLTGCDHHPGDTLIVDLDLSVENLPVGTRLAVGSAVIEVSDVENDGCAKFAAHYGDDVFDWIRAEGNRAKRLRGLFARVGEVGTVKSGDTVRVVSRIKE